MKRLLLLLILVLLSSKLYTNDGTYYYTSGNFLIPLTETDISVKKEILSMKKILNNEGEPQLQVSVYYEFFNPGEARKLLVGYEAYPPWGEGTNSAPTKKGNPYMYDFTVKMNGEILKYNISLMHLPENENDLYLENGKLKELTQSEIKMIEDEFEYPFRYVYHFDADFNEGLNIVEHTFVCDLASYQGLFYEYAYILSAAMRWANGQIDDFTLNIHIADEVFEVYKTFYDSKDEWKIIGEGRMINSWADKDAESEIPNDEEAGGILFYIRDGYAQFKKDNFRPNGEFMLKIPGWGLNLLYFNYKRDRLLYPISATNKEVFNNYHEYEWKKLIEELDPVSKKILRNLPFARRGHTFTDPVIQEYYESQVWYMPDETYVMDFTTLPHTEQEWVMRFKE